MISSTQINKLNKMNRAAQDVSLGTLISGFQGSSATTVSAAQSNASAVIVDIVQKMLANKASGIKLSSKS